MKPALLRPLRCGALASCAFRFRTGLAAGLCALWLAPAPAEAGGGLTEPPGATKPAKASKPASRRAPQRKQAPPPPPPAPLAVATPEQIEAAERVFYGLHQCEFAQSVDVAISPEQPGYVSVKFGKAVYVMRPVLSSTGAIRLEDVTGETLMVQITAKSMLLNVKSASRLVDECVSVKHHEAMEAASLSEAAASAAAVSAAAAASAAAPHGASAPAAAQ